MNTLTLFLTVLILRPFLPCLCGVSSALPFFCAFAFFPILVCLLNGQDCTVMLLLFAGAFVAMKHQRDFLAGVCFGLALIKFQYVVPILAIFMLRRKWSVLAGAVATGVLLTMASAAFTGWPTTLGYSYPLLQLSQSSPDLTVTTGMPNLRNIRENLLRRSGLAAIWILSLVSLALIVFVARRCNFDVLRSSFSLEFSLAVTVSLIVSYHLWTHDLTLLLLPLLLISEEFLEGSIAYPAKGILLPVVVLLLFSPLLVLLALSNWHVPILFWVMILVVLGVASAIRNSEPTICVHGELAHEAAF